MEKSKIWKVLSLLVFLPAGLVLVTFAVVNRHPVILNLWPLPIDLAVPLSLIVMFSLIFGVVWGGVASWLASRTSRRQAREIAKRAGKAEAEVGQLRGKVKLLESEDGSGQSTAMTSSKVA